MYDANHATGLKATLSLDVGHHESFPPSVKVEAAKRGLERAVTQLADLDAISTSCGWVSPHKVISAIHEILEAITLLVEQGCSRFFIVELLSSARAIHAKSPLIRRMQVWPRGYVGDFETVELLLSSCPESPYGSLEYWLEYYLLNSPAVQQHKNKVEQQARIISNVIQSNPAASIVILGCGSSPDLRQIASNLSCFCGDLWLVDSDVYALHASKAAVQSLPPACTRFVHANVLAFLRRPPRAVDLIVAGGLFDYLDDRALAFVLKRAYECLKRNGELFFTNLGRDNLLSVWMRYLGDWVTVDRTREALLKSLELAGIPLPSTKASLDSSGITHLVHVVKSIDTKGSMKSLSTEEPESRYCGEEQ